MGERFNFTKASLAELLTNFDGRKLVYDTKQPGLIVELRSAESLSFFLYKRIHGQPKRHRIGGFPDLTVEQARTECQKLIGRIAAGEDPTAERRAARVEHTVGALFDHWVASHATGRLRSWEQEKRRFDKHLLHLRTRRLSSISRAELQSLHAKLGKESGPVLANRVLALVKKLFNKADSIGYRGLNPASKIAPFPEQSRDRFLQPDEVPKFWKALSLEQQIFQDFFLVALLTGVRRGNVEAMRWEDLHLDSASWRVPRTKNSEPLLVHLPAKALEILCRREAERTDSPWVFPSWGRTGHIVEPKASWRRILDAAGLKNLRIHDLRRTLGSWQAIAGASLPVIGRSLGHKSLASTEIYSRLTFEPVRQSVDVATNAILAATKPKKPKKPR